MADYTFIEGIDYKIHESPEDPYISVIEWDFSFVDDKAFNLHPDFTSSSSFNIEYSSLSWEEFDDNYIKYREDKIIFQPLIKENTSVDYDGDGQKSFSILNIVPIDQYSSNTLIDSIHMLIWRDNNYSTLEIYKIRTPESFITQDESCDFYYIIDYE